MAYEMTGTWDNSAIPTKSRERDTAEATTSSTKGDVTAHALASGQNTTDHDSNATAATQAKFKATVDWKGAGDPPPGKIKISVNFDHRHDVVVRAQKPEAASVTAYTTVAITYDNRTIKSKHPDSVIPLTAPPSDTDTMASTAPDTLESGIIEHTGSIGFEVTIYAYAHAERTGGDAFAQATVELKNCVVTPQIT